LRLQSQPAAPPLQGPVLRIAPSVDPVQRTLLVMGRVTNPANRLLAGQYIMATIYVQPEPGLVEIPTRALNEENGQSLVFVQPDRTKPEYALRRVAVADRFRDVVFIRSQPMPGEGRVSPGASTVRFRPPEPLRPGERVVTQSVPMLTVALR